MNLSFGSGFFLEIGQVVWETYLVLVYISGIGFVKVIDQLVSHMRTGRDFSVAAHFNHLEKSLGTNFGS